MPSNKKDLKARLMKEAEDLIDKLLDEKKSPDEILLSDIEKAAIEKGKRFQQAIARELTTESETYKGERPKCAGCGEPMRFKDYRSRRVETEAGEVEVKRAYYYCQACGSGIFPPG